MVKFISPRVNQGYPAPLSEHIKHGVEDAPDYCDGALESVEQKLNVLMDIVSTMADSLSVPAQKRLAASLFLQEVQEVEEPPEFPLPVRAKE